MMMDVRTFNKLRTIIKEQSGIELNQNKEALMMGRVGKRMRKLGLPDYKDYLKFLLEDESGQEMIQLLDVISTNVTSFYREAVHFEFLKNLLRSWEDEGQSKYRIWCAAASSGEEPYTIAITVEEALRAKHRDVKILGTDISTVVLEKCVTATYEERKVEPVPRPMLSKYFIRHRDENGDSYEVVPELRSMMLFKRLNLTVQPYPMKGPLDIIFCRNVMIYFNNETRQKIINEMYRLIKPGGYLFVGHSESLTGLDTRFRIIKPSIYQRPD